MDNSRIITRFKEKYLKQEKAFTPRNVANLFTDYKLDAWSRALNTVFTLKDCLFRVAKLNKILIRINFLIQDAVLGLVHVHLFQFSAL